MAFNSRLDPWIGDQRRRIIQARSEAEPIIDKPICHDPIHDTPDQTLARQKRRKAIGQRYLAGRGAPFIMSAQLKGPFDKSSGWNNPWLGKAEEEMPKENLRPFPLQKAAHLTGRSRNNSVASVRSVISIASNSQSVAGADRLNSLRQPPVAAKPNLHGGLKQFLGATAGVAPSSARKPEILNRRSDRDNIPQLPPLKRKADTSWLKGADIVKKKRKQLPDLPSPTPPSRVGQEQRGFVTPTNLLDKFRQHIQIPFSQGSPNTQRLTEAGSQGGAFADIPTDARAPRPLSSKLSQIINRRSTSDASALTATYEEPVRPLAARVRSLNGREVVGSGSFHFRRTKRLPDYVSEGVISSIEKDEDYDENDDNTVVPESGLETQVAQLTKQHSNKPVSVPAPTSVRFYKPIASALKPEESPHQEAPSFHTAEEIRDKQGRVRNSQSLPSDSESEIESPEKARLISPEEHKLCHTYTTGPITKQNEAACKVVPGEILVPSTAEEPSRIAESQNQRHHSNTIHEVVETTGKHADGGLATANTDASVTEDLGVDLLNHETLDEDEHDTTMPDIPDIPGSTLIAEEDLAKDRIVGVEASQDVMENTYVKMATGSLSTSNGGNPSPAISHTQSTAMNTQVIETLKANLLEESGDEEDIITPASRRSFSAKKAIQPKMAADEDTESDISQGILRSAARPQISSSEPTIVGTNRWGTQGISGPQILSLVQMGGVAGSLHSTRSTEKSQTVQQGAPHISNQRWAASSTTLTYSEPVITRIIRDRSRILSSEPTNTGTASVSHSVSTVADWSLARQNVCEHATEFSSQSPYVLGVDSMEISDTTASILQAANTSLVPSSIQQSDLVDSTASSGGSEIAQRPDERPQISSTEATQISTAAPVSQIGSTSVEQSSAQPHSMSEPTESSEQAQCLQRQPTLPHISDNEPMNIGTTALGFQVVARPATQISTQSDPVVEPTVDDILRIIRSSQRRDDGQDDRMPTPARRDVQAAFDGGTTTDDEQTFKLLTSTQGEQPPISSPYNSQVYSHAGSQYKSSQLNIQVQLDFQSSQPQSYVHGQVGHEIGGLEGSSISTNTGTTTTESLLLQAIAQDMARPDEGEIAQTGLTESSHEKSSGGKESTQKVSQSQRTMASMQEAQVGTPSHEIPTHSDDQPVAPEVLQEPKTQSWHISTIEDETVMDVDYDVTEAPSQNTEAMVLDSKPTSSPPPSGIPALTEAAPSAAQPTLSLSDNPWANGTQRSSAKLSPKKRVAFSDPLTSSSMDDDDLDRPAQQTQHNKDVLPSCPQRHTAHLPSSPPLRMVSAPPAEQLMEIPMFSPPPVYHEPSSTESPFPIIINGLRNHQPQILPSSQGVGGMANAFLAADRLAPVPEREREDTLSPPKMLPPALAQERTPEPMGGVEEAKSRAGQSSVARQLAAMYPSSSEDEGESDVKSPSKARQIRNRSRKFSHEESPKLLSQEPYREAGKSTPPALRVGARIQVNSNSSPIMDPYTNPWATQQPPASPEQEEEEEDYDELPPFAMGNILGMLGDEFGSGRAQGDMEENGVGAVADEMSDLLETWDLDEELQKTRRENRGEEREDKRSARERIGWSRF